MKKFTLMQALLLALLTLLLGFFTGMLIDYPHSDTDDLAGTIGKAGKYHNVKVTEEDIMLRNELIEDTALRSQYQKYLTYYYYQAIKTNSDIETVLKNTAGQEAFKDYVPVLNKISAHMKTARIDIYAAIQFIRIIDSVQNLPMNAVLNDAGNAIARMGNQTNALMYYLEAIGSYLDKNPTLATAELKDAHDILALNLMISASVANDKPTMKYLEKKKLANDKERVNELIADVTFNSETSRQMVASDNERLKSEFAKTDKEVLRTGFTDQVALYAGFTDQSAMNALINNGFPVIVDQITAGSAALLESTRVGNAEVLRLVYLDQSPLNVIIFTDTEKLLRNTRL